MSNLFSQYAVTLQTHLEKSQFRQGQHALNQRQWHQAVCETLAQSNRVFVIGNGGSASIAAHFVVDLVNILSISAHCLHESALLTCFSNDYGYERAFAEMLNKIAQPKDTLVVISSSGRSQNIYQAVKTMSAKGGQVISLTGFNSDNPVSQLTLQNGGLSAWLPSDQYGFVETGHQIILHAVIDFWQTESPSKSKDEAVNES